MPESTPPPPDPVGPLLPLRNSVLFPAAVVPVNVGRPQSVRLIEEAFEQDRPTIAVVAQRKAEVEEPTLEDLYDVGTVARVLKVIRLSSGNYSIVLQGISRVRILEQVASEPCLRVNTERIADVHVHDVELEALCAHLREAARRLSSSRSSGRQEAGLNLDNVQEPGVLADLVANTLPINVETKQEILETLEVRERLRKVVDLVNRQSEVHRVKKEITTLVQEEMSRSQREFLLRQQMKTIRRELGDVDDEEDEIEELRDRIVQADMTAEAEQAARRQIKRMRSMSAASAEYQLSRTYVEWLVDLPWRKSTPERLDVSEARRVLDEDHHGLEKAKRRILEYIAVRRLRSDKRGPILCFVGPPGVGKTSLARSIARSTGRDFVRVSLGGVQDEAEIRGHRRTYVGAYPGRIVSGLKKAGSKNPVMLLDEVDKLGSSRGDPASALLEVLDPEQNEAFVDHYLEVPIALNQILFIATANRRDLIPPPLLDRTELIELPGYTREEKRAIARQFLVPRQLSEHGLTPDRLDFTDEAIERVVDEYTYEAGVRKLEQQVASVCRAVAVRLAHGEDVHVEADSEFVETVLGPPRHQRQRIERKSAAGIATGLAWTPAGGDLLIIETTRMPGTGKIHLTGRMGDIMKESVAAAFTYVRARASTLGLPHDFLSRIDLHVHLPQGAVPKDGPSAGMAIYLSLVSVLTRIRIPPHLAVTGEITLRGNVLKVGGIKEKCLAAHRAGVKQVVLPKRNEPDLDEVPDEILRELDVRLVSRVDEVLQIVRDHQPAAVHSPPPAA